MNRKITLLSLKCLALIGFTQVLSAQQIYTNGPLSTGATSASGVAAPSGYTWSEIQSETGNTTESNTSIGYSAYYLADGSTSFAIADDFVVPTGEIWNVSSFDFFIYQTNYAGVTPPIDELRVQVYNGNPSAGGTVYAGNLTANVFDAANSIDASIYRTGNSVTPVPGTVPGTARKLWKVRGTLTTDLPAGTYWVVFQGHATNNAAFFSPPVTVTGFRGLPEWNGQQLTVPTAAWSNLNDTGNPAAAPDFPQAMAFIVNGGVLGINQNEIMALNATPNPVRDVLNLSSSNDITSVEIFNMLGQQVLVKTINAAQSQVDMSQLNSGTYMVKVLSDKQQKTIKVVKE